MQDLKKAPILGYKNPPRSPFDKGGWKGMESLLQWFAKTFPKTILTLGVTVKACKIIDAKIGKQHTQKADDREKSDLFSTPAPDHP